MTLKKVFIKTCFWVFFMLAVMIIQVFTAVAQFDSETSYEVTVAVPAVKNNFARAREKALKIALRTALEQDLREFLGEESFERNLQEIQRMLKRSEKYVKSYRFLEAFDDPIELVSHVKLEVVLFQDAVSNYLSRIGVDTGLEGDKQVVILINETSIGSNSELRFWETIPISETSLTRNFIEAGIPVVRRNSIRYAIPEQTVMSAVKGDVSAAVNIGLKAGADIVIVGNATSTPLKDGRVHRQQPVRVAISIKAVSSHNSTLIAAKSDFATGSENEVLASELEAFHRAGRELTDFLIPTIQKYWKVGDEKKEVKQLAPSPKTDSTSLPWDDL